MEAPSLILEALAAVIVPFYLTKAGLSLVIFSGLYLVGSWSASKTTFPLAFTTGIISFLYKFYLIASNVLSYDFIQYSSFSYLVILKSVAVFSAQTPIAYLS